MIIKSKPTYIRDITVFSIEDYLFNISFVLKTNIAFVALKLLN